MAELGQSSVSMLSIHIPFSDTAHTCQRKYDVYGSLNRCIPVCPVLMWGLLEHDKCVLQASVYIDIHQ